MISTRKVNAIFSKNMKTIFHNMFVSLPLILAPLMAFAFTRIPGVGDEAYQMLPMFIIMNLFMSASTVVCTLMAEEKEKNTLGVLITSTVSVWDFLISILLIALFFTTISNIFVFFIVGANALLSIGLFMIITTIAALPAALFGAVIGIVSKNQMIASSIISPFFMALIFLPMFGADNALVNNVVYYFFTEQLTAGLIYARDYSALPLMSLLIIGANALVFTVIFALFYKRRGLGMD